MNNKEKKEIILKIKSDDRNIRLFPNNVPDEYKNDIDVIKAERKSGMRTIERRGFDVINQRFFIHESVLNYSERFKEENWKKSVEYFTDFEEYYKYLNGDIYDNACYYQFDFSKIKRKINISKAKEKKSFIDYNIEDYTFEPSEDLKNEYTDGEKRKTQIKKWINKFNKCSTANQLNEVVDSYYKSKLYSDSRIDVEFFFWQYVFFDVNSRRRFKAIMKYMSTGRYPEWHMIRPLCHVYDPDEVLGLYDYSSGAKQTIYKHKRELNNYVMSLKNSGEKVSNTFKAFFDKKTHFYCERSNEGVCHYFDTFEELLKYRKNNLSNTDLSDDINLSFDLFGIEIDETTILPLKMTKKIKYIVIKEFFNNVFIVKQEWRNSNNIIVKEYNHKFTYFFDFVAFLKGDLSGADLILCDGILNLIDIDGLNFSDAKMTSILCDKIGLEYKQITIDSKYTKSFEITKKNEKTTDLEIQSSKDLEEIEDENELGIEDYDLSSERIYYITDLHLCHMLKNHNVRSENDIKCILGKTVHNIVKESGKYVLIGGDISSDYRIFEMFISMLRKELDQYHFSHPQIIFVLGNHDLWSFPGLTFSSIVKKYEKLISENNMYLLQNDILYLDANKQMNKISNSELVQSSVELLREKLRTARIMFFGGLAFSGYNENFNANNGIYSLTINRKEEIKESMKFEKLYKKILQIVPDRNVVIFTHMPMDCWMESVQYQNNYIYVSGHTHKNYFYDDGEKRIYSDNQVGYSNKNPFLKWFYIESDYDYFSDYSDGIYQISREQYIDFYRGKNIGITYNRDPWILYMLKKNGYYCFIQESKSGQLCLLNGGAIKRLEYNDIEYYYKNIDIVIKNIRSPLDKYTEIQRTVSRAIKLFGGWGSIHGCIIDIDFYNHVYVNPIDLKITAYSAENIIRKKVYPGVPALLEKECPDLFIKYQKLLKGGSDKLPKIISNKESIKTVSHWYLNTDIYKVSRIIKKMQRLNSNILTVWIENGPEQMWIEQEK